AKIYGIEKDQEMTEMDTALNGQILTKNEKNARTVLIDKIKKEGFDQTIEEVAYTWFNRFIALRFMEVNGYLPSHIRVFSSEDNEFQPQILSEAIHIELDGLDQSKVLDLYNAGNKEEELFSYLLITQCNALNQVLPGIFQKINDYTELLLPEGLLREGSVIDSMIKDIPEDDWKEQVQIIGWLYQYYISEQKDEVFSRPKTQKIQKEDIPAATQLFTPDWIVRYMVENSLGKLWYEGHPDEELKTSWKYYLEEADQENEVEEKLKEIRKEYADLKPEQIKCIDPCIGSGHIGVYLFDVLIQIYESQGYKNRDAVRLILEKNIYGLDIDERARQLAYFSLMMKAREHDRRFLTRDYIPQPKVYVVEESNYLKTESNRHALDYFINGNKELKEAIESIINDMEDAKEYGSITIVKPVDFKFLYQRFDEIKAEEITLDRLMILDELLPIVEIAEVLSSKYDVVVTNPPYMGNLRTNPNLQGYINKNYVNSKADLFAVFIEVSNRMTKKNRFQAMITQHSWMFLSSFEKLREQIQRTDIINMVHLGPRAFEEISGEVVQTTSFVLRNFSLKEYNGTYARLIDANSQNAKEEMFLSGENRYITSQNDFDKIPGMPISYWASRKIFHIFKNTIVLNDVSTVKKGMDTGNNEKYLRIWNEVNFTEIGNINDVKNKKWNPYTKGGVFRKWYGNNEHLVYWKDDGSELLNNKKANIRSRHLYLKESLTWTLISGNKNLSLRYCPKGFIFDSNGSFIQSEKYMYYIQAYLNSVVGNEIIKYISSTLAFNISDISSMPFILSDKDKGNIDVLVKSNIAISKNEWDMHETSWDFKGSPLVANKSDGLITSAYESYKSQVNERFRKLKENEEELNRIFIEIYGLEDELTPDVANKDITVAKIFDKKEDIDEDIKGNRYIMTREDVVKNFLSYFIGCLMGRYSLDVDGLAFAGGDFDTAKYASFKADVDGVLPLTDAQYFEEDIVETFIQFLKVIFGEEHLNENLNFIASELKGKQTDSTRDKIRNYFLSDFYADHCKMYQKLPIYWQYDSGKNNACKGLFYLHRYDKDTFARIRINYVFEIQDRYKQELSRLENKINGASASERVALQKEADALKKKILESQTFEEKIQHLADSYIAIDLDDGVAENYKIFKDVLTKIK
ncbi:MAG: BREX-1 system adenine-specific DNA-methyltransferase PglX, partial [Tissierellia bacterium]|nr:BREX-1 system adenine-specific DNA-methyltransferase PglX [Tissierellia bacterium]